MGMGTDEVVVNVRSVMTRPLVAVEAEASIMDAANVMNERNISSVLVKAKEEYVGIITDRDIISKVVAKGADPRTVSARAIMSAPLITINAEASVEDAAEQMRVNTIRRLIVNENHRQIGIISESDIMRVDSELHFLIREHSKIDCRPSATDPQAILITGFCEDCGNYSRDLGNVSGTWLCEECRS
jgi:signal-transduction protein with cAMP-binding, CBS, and nucleotidyltransferase domain